MKLTLKGIVTREDAELAVEQGVDEIVLSSCEGRSDPSGRGTIKLVPVQGRVPVLLGGGIRRGTDVFKGLAAFGQEGVEAVIRLLSVEFEIAMCQAVTTTANQITCVYVVHFGTAAANRR